MNIVANQEAIDSIGNISNKVMLTSFAVAGAGTGSLLFGSGIALGVALGALSAAVASDIVNSKIIDNLLSAVPKNINVLKLTSVFFPISCGVAVGAPLSVAMNHLDNRRQVVFSNTASNNDYAQDAIQSIKEKTDIVLEMK
jgi:hypothetical protein